MDNQVATMTLTYFQDHLNQVTENVLEGTIYVCQIPDILVLCGRRCGIVDELGVHNDLDLLPISRSLKSGHRKCLRGYHICLPNTRQLGAMWQEVLGNCIIRCLQ